MLTEILAIYAAVVSTVSAATAYFAYKSGDPKLSGHAEIRGKIDRSNPHRSSFHKVLRISLNNRGRGAITVDTAEVWCPRYSSREPMLELDVGDFKISPRIEGHSGIRWEIPFDDPSWKSLVSENAEFGVLVVFASGATLTLGVNNVIGAIIEEARNPRDPRDPHL